MATVPRRLHFAPDIPSPQGGWGPHGGSKEFVTPGELREFGEALARAVREFAEQSLPDWIAQRFSERDAQRDVDGEALLNRIEAVAPITYTPPASSDDNGVIELADTTGATEYAETGKVLQKLHVTAKGQTAAPVSGDWVQLPTVPSYGYKKVATATANYADPTGGNPYCTVTATIEGVVGAQTIRLYYKSGLEYPNVRDGQYLEVFQDASGNWCCMGPHDRPVGSIEYNINYSGTPTARPGWKFDHATVKGKFLWAYEAGVTGNCGVTGGRQAHEHACNSHLHSITAGSPTGAAAGTDVDVYPPPANTDYQGTLETDTQDHMPPYVVVPCLVRVNKTGE